MFCKPSFYSCFCTRAFGLYLRVSRWPHVQRRLRLIQRIAANKNTIFENIYVTASKYANKRKLHVHVGFTLIINMYVIIRPITSYELYGSCDLF